MKIKSLFSFVIIIVLAYIALRVTALLVRGLLGLAIVALLVYLVVGLKHGDSK